MIHSWLKIPPQSFSAWLKDNPEPDLLALAKHYGGLGNVPESVMQTFEAARAEWQLKMRSRHEGLETPELKPEPTYHEESEPGADIPPEILKTIEANMKQRGIMRRACLKKEK
jgi:hypothetical protein